MTNKQPEALRLAATFHISSRIGWRRAALEQLRTQHALLERARLALRSLYDRRTDSTMEFSRSTLAALNQHLEPK